MKHVNLESTPPFLDGDTDVQIHIYISINQLQKLVCSKRTGTAHCIVHWLIQNNAKFMDNATVFVLEDKGHKASVGNFSFMLYKSVFWYPNSAGLWCSMWYWIVFILLFSHFTIEWNSVDRQTNTQTSNLLLRRTQIIILTPGETQQRRINQAINSIPNSLYFIIDDLQTTFLLIQRIMDTYFVYFSVFSPDISPSAN